MVDFSDEPQPQNLANSMQSAKLIWEPCVGLCTMCSGIILYYERNNYIIRTSCQHC